MRNHTTGPPVYQTGFSPVSPPAPFHPVGKLVLARSHLANTYQRRKNYCWQVGWMIFAQLIRTQKGILEFRDWTSKCRVICAYGGGGLAVAIEQLGCWLSKISLRWFSIFQLLIGGFSHSHCTLQSRTPALLGVSLNEHRFPRTR